VFDRIVVNADHAVFAPLAAQHRVEFYLRPAELGSSAAKSDSVVFDFMTKHPSDAVAWVNPTSPLQTGEEIRRVVDHFNAHNLDSLITVKEERVHGLVQGAPINFNPDGPFAATQDLPAVQLFVYSVMMWRTATFLEAFRRRGYALLSGKVGYVPVGKRASVIIKTAEDLQFAESLLAAPEASDIRYDAGATTAVKERL
jgi:CMP-N-acetylneuraminic acid synthetase